MPKDKNPQNEITALEPDRRLKKMIGENLNLNTIFTKEKIAECQQVINDARKDFFESVQPELKQFVELVETPEIPQNEDAFFERASQLATSIRGQSEMFGFVLITKICTHIHDFCEMEQWASAKRYLLISDLIKALQLAVDRKIADDGGVVGRELLSHLNASAQ